MAIETPRETAMLPATPETPADMPAEARAAIRITLDGTTYCLPVAPLMAGYSEENAPDFITGKNQTGKAMALRSLLKGGLSLAWPMVTDFVKAMNKEFFMPRGLPPLPLPDLKTRRKDGLLYFVQYAMGISLTTLCSMDWEAKGEPLGRDDRYVRLSGLSSPSFPTLDAAKTGGIESGADDSNDSYTRP